MGLDILPLKLRLIRVKLDTGITEVLITSLIDKDSYPAEIFMELYHKRWPVEEDYKTMKCWLEVENFSGKSVLSVYQDFYAKVFSKNLTSVLAFPTREIIEQNSRTCKHPRQINFTQALSRIKNVIVLLFNPQSTEHDTRHSRDEVIKIAKEKAKQEGFDLSKYDLKGCHYEYIEKDNTT